MFLVNVKNDYLLKTYIGSRLTFSTECKDNDVSRVSGLVLNILSEYQHQCGGYIREHVLFVKHFVPSGIYNIVFKFSLLYRL